MIFPALIVLTILAAAVQAQLPAFAWLGGAHLELMPGLAAYSALSFRRTPALGLALVAGFAQDALSATPFGLTALVYGFAAVVLGASRATLDRDLPWVQMGAAAAASLAVGLVSCLARGSLLVNLPRILLVATTAGLISPLIFLAVDMLKQGVATHDH